MNYDDIFGDNIYEEDVRDIQQDFNDLEEIFHKNGFDKQLSILTLANCDLMGLATLYKENKDDEMNYKRLIHSMAIVHTLIETFVITDDEICDTFEEVRKRYIEKELDKKSIIPVNVQKRLSYLKENKIL
ncbi:MAG: hypothetical protein M0Q88_02965 [Bacilli bacterium]|nr:hypothetical protein [Bacilli bacterium]